MAVCTLEWQKLHLHSERSCSYPWYYWGRNWNLNQYLYRVRKDPCTFFFNYLAHVFRQEVISDLFAKLVCLFFTPPGLLLYLLYQRDLAWGKNQAWVANNNFSRSHALLQKLKTVIANEAGIYLMLLHTTILSQSCRNADCKNIAFYAFNATQYENNAYFQKLDLGS